MRTFNTLEELEEKYLQILTEVQLTTRDELDEEEINEESYEVFQKRYGVDFEEEYDRLS